MPTVDCVQGQDIYALINFAQGSLYYGQVATIVMNSHGRGGFAPTGMSWSQ